MAGRKRGVGPAVAAPPDAEAAKRAAAVLEVLGGLATPTEAAQALSVSLPRYYHLEKLALAGLVAACAPAGRRGRRLAPERETERLREEVKRLEREASRNLALARAAGRAAGLAPKPKPAKPAAEAKRRKRRPTVRALAVARVLRAEAGRENVPAPAGVGRAVT